MWPFSRKPKSLNPGPINEDWRVGDLAECIIAEGYHWDRIGPGPERGDVLAVMGVVAGIGTNTRRPGWFLDLRGFHGAFSARDFRKVPPLNTEASAEFTAKIKAISKRHARTPAA